jgi:beta-N-acetylhexosaminidase
MQRAPVEARGQTTTLADRKCRAGQRLLLGLGGAALSDDERRIALELRPAGFLLARSNLVEAAQVVELCRELKAIVGDERPAVLALDLRPLPSWAWSSPWPGPAALGERADPAFTHEIARALGDEVAALGVHLLLDPPAQVDAGDGGIEGEESFGRDPDRVARHVLAFTTGLQETGVAAAVRYFPGCGAASRGTTPPVVDRDPGDLRAFDLRAFAAVVRRFPSRLPSIPEAAGGRPPSPVRAGAGGGGATREGTAAAVLLPQVLFPGLDEKRTAARSPTVIGGWLREGMDFAGLAIAEAAPLGDGARLTAAAVQAGAAAAVQAGAAAAVQAGAAAAVQAGADLVLLPGPAAMQVDAWEALVRLQEDEALAERRIETSDRRLLAFRLDFLRPWGEGATLPSRARPPLEHIDCAAHRRLALGARGSRRPS